MPWSGLFARILTTLFTAESSYFKINDKSIGELADWDISELKVWFDELPSKLSEKQLKIG